MYHRGARKVSLAISRAPAAGSVDPPPPPYERFPARRRRSAINRATPVRVLQRDALEEIMKTLSHILFGLALAAPLTITTAVHADDKTSSPRGDKQDVTMDQLPKAVKATVQRESKGKNVESMKKSTKNGVVAYEIKILDGTKETTLDVAKDGKVRDRQVRT